MEIGDAHVCGTVRSDGGAHVVNSTAQININKMAFYLSRKSGIFGTIFMERHLDVACARHCVRLPLSKGRNIVWFALLATLPKC